MKNAGRRYLRHIDLFRAKRQIRPRISIERKFSVPVRRIMHYRQSSRNLSIIFDAGNVYPRSCDTFAKHPSENVVSDFSDKSGPASQLREHRQKITRRSSRISLEQQITALADSALRKIYKQLP